jgi:hypothetical protein
MGEHNMAAKKSSSRSNTKGRAKVGKVMREFKKGELKSGGRRTVRNPKQAIAIALSEARQSGAKIPKKGAAKKSASKKTSAKKSSARKGASTKKAAAKKAPAKKSTGRKTAAKKTPRKSSRG